MNCRNVAFLFGILAVLFSFSYSLVSLGRRTKPQSTGFSGTYLGVLGECIKYKTSETPVPPKGYEMVTMVVGNITFVKIWTCPELEAICEPVEVISRTLTCLVCRGHCVYAGEVYAENASISAIDGQTSCTCQPGGKLDCPPLKKLTPTKDNLREFCL